MLLRFSFENFRSFRKRTTLDMNAKRQTTLNDVLIRNGKKRVLPCAVLYGANASGKSNVLLAMHVFSNIILSGTVSAHPAMELFPFLHDGNTAPISFETDFIVDETEQFIYSLAFSVEPLNPNGKRFILNEKLEKICVNNQVMLFHRTQNDIEIGNDRQALKILGYKDHPALLLTLKESMIKNLDGQTLFLTAGFKSTICKAIANKIIDFLTAGIVSMHDVSTNLQKIIELEVKEEGTADEFIIEDELFNKILKAADCGPQRIGIYVEGKDKRDKKQLQIVSNYRDAEILSEHMESTGTLRLLRFSLLLKIALSNGLCLMVDELDNALHPEIIKAIIALFNNPDINKKGAQLIFTTHNPIYMDRALLRRDQILFTEKDPDTYES
ncbi:MAG: ATP-binding protein, partial [Clostridiales bacterium]|nr:ATP-binding protein [Clostridiales bacterium]